MMKTQILKFNYVPDEEIKGRFKFNWDLNFIKYLGVNLPQDLSQLKFINYDTLISKIKSDLERWNLIPFTSLVSRVEVIKMIILPKLLYTFQTPVHTCRINRRGFYRMGQTHLKI